MSISWAPRGDRTVLRGGAGIFYDRRPWQMAEQALLLGTDRVRQVVISAPAFPNPFTTTAMLPPPSITTIAPGIRAPYLVQASVAVEHSFAPRTLLSVEYTTSRGIGLFRTRDINALLPGSGVRPDARFFNIYQFESTGSSRSNRVSVMLRTNLKKRLELLSEYTLGKTTDDTSGMFSLPADNFNLAAERGRADYDRRHRLNIATIVTAPKAFKLGLIGSFSSGIPFNVTTGFDNNNDSIVNDRPAGVTRNTGQGPGYADIDVRLSKRFKLPNANERKSTYLELRMDAFNLLNHVNAVNFVGNLSSPLFGHANSALPPRQLQMSMKMSF